MYIRAATGLSLRYNGCGFAFNNLGNKSLTYILKRFGLKGHACLRPRVHTKNCVHLFPSFTEDDEFF